MVALAPAAVARAQADAGVAPDGPDAGTGAGPDPDAGAEAPADANAGASAEADAGAEASAEADADADADASAEAEAEANADASPEANPQASAGASAQGSAGTGASSGTVPRPRVVAPQAVDDERPPNARPISASARRASGRAERIAAARAALEAAEREPEEVDELASPHPPPPDPYRGRRYAVRAASRTMTLAEGVARVDHAAVWRVIFALEAPNTVAVGVTNDLEISVAWPWTREPTLTMTGRVFGSDVLDVGLRGSVTPPLIRNGDTVVRGGVPIVIRAHRLLRIQTGLDIDLLLTPQISPWASIPLQLLGSVTDRVFMGLQGSVGWLDGAVWTAQVGTFVGHTVSATDGHPIFEVRWSGTYIIDTPAFHIGAALTIYPRLW